MDVAEQLARARDAMTAKTVYAEAVTKDGVTVIPAARIRGGAGGGGGHGPQGEGQGTGFGLVADPIGAWVLKGGSVTWRPAIDVNRAILGCQLVALVALVVGGRRLQSRRPR